MADLFLSYKREDKAKVAKLAAALRATGLDVWWDEDIPPSAPWEATIERELIAAKAVVVCWSPAAVASENVRSEARIAREDGRLIQVFVKPCEPPLFFGERQGVELVNWRGRADDPRIARVAASIRQVAAGERVAGGEPPKRRRVDARLWAAAAAVLLLMASAAAWWLLAPASDTGPTKLAVLPFRALNPADANLVDAIWDDTRGALSRNPNLRVLGRSAVESMSEKRPDPAAYRHKLGAQYLLDGAVQRVGDRVEIKVHLVNTTDGAEMWSDRIGGRLDDVFAFQSRIAQEVEGRVRGRVAPGGGIRSQNIASSGEVYAIFADARAKIRKRDRDSLSQAIALLRKALAIDPNYAPAWAELGIATKLYQTGDQRSDLRQAAAVSYLKHALSLAPNLAHAHAALAMVQSFPPATENDLKRAVALDPNDAEAWTWLGNLYSGQNRFRDAVSAHDQAVEIEPLWYTGIANKIGAMTMLGDKRGVDDELGRAKATHEGALLLKLRAVAAGSAGQPGEQARLLLQLRDQYPAEASFANTRLPYPLLALGYLDEALRLRGSPAGVAALYHGDFSPQSALAHDYAQPRDLWLDGHSLAVIGRLLRKQRRLTEYVGFYRAAFRNADAFFDGYQARPRLLTMLAPNVAANLRDGRQQAQAERILQRTESMIAPWLRNGPPTRDMLAQLAELRAAEGKSDQAMVLLTKAVAQGWLPDRSVYATDIADEPSFAQLKARTDFQAVRARIFRRLHDQRGRLGQVHFTLAA